MKKIAIVTAVMLSQTAFSMKQNMENEKPLPLAPTQGESISPIQPTSQANTPINPINKLKLVVKKPISQEEISRANKTYIERCINDGKIYQDNQVKLNHSEFTTLLAGVVNKITSGQGGDKGSLNILVKNHRKLESETAELKKKLEQLQKENATLNKSTETNNENLKILEEKLKISEESLQKAKENKKFQWSEVASEGAALEMYNAEKESLDKISEGWIYNNGKLVIDNENEVLGAILQFSRANEKPINEENEVNDEIANEEAINL